MVVHWEVFDYESKSPLQIAIRSIKYDRKSSRESALKEERNVFADCWSPLPVYFAPPTHLHVGVPWVDLLPGARLRDKLSVLEDWATALNSRRSHSKPRSWQFNIGECIESVGIVHGRGTLLDQGLSPGYGLDEQPPDDDIRGARWAATEFFRLENGNLRPTKMSDVYSFGCLMLQMLTGRIPYCATKRPEKVVYLKYLGREPIDAETPELADHYVTFMRHCWSPEPEKRPTMSAIVDFIREEIKNLGGRHE